MLGGSKCLHNVSWLRLWWKRLLGAGEEDVPSGATASRQMRLVSCRCRFTAAVFPRCRRRPPAAARAAGRCFRLERTVGVEPTSSLWKSEVLPLNDVRIIRMLKCWGPSLVPFPWNWGRFPGPVGPAMYRSLLRRELSHFAGIVRLPRQGVGGAGSWVTELYGERHGFRYVRGRFS